MNITRLRASLTSGLPIGLGRATTIDSLFVEIQRHDSASIKKSDPWLLCTCN
jgi:hypothetical protein